jgi:hypothetical protein
MIAALVLVAFAAAAYARSAGTHPVTATLFVPDTVVTGSIKKKGGSVGDDTAGSVRKPKAHHPELDR